jgi:hypothetical protein
MRDFMHLLRQRLIVHGAAAFLGLTNFHNTMALFNFLHDHRPDRDKPAHQNAANGVSDPNPNNLRSIRIHSFEKREILIFCYDYCIDGSCIAPDFYIQRRFKTKPGRVRRLMPMLNKPSGERGWQVCIDDKPHYSAAAMTG